MLDFAKAALAALTLFVWTAPASATTVPFSENFDASSSGWFDAAASAPLDFVASGGPDGSGYASGVFNFASSALDDSATILRGQDEFGFSGGNFIGNWIADGVGVFTAQLRHDASVPLTFFARFSSPFNFPGGIAIQFAPLLPGQWTEFRVDLNATNPQFVSFEGQSFTDVFSNVGHIQIGVNVPASLAGLDQTFSFDVDQVSIAAPEPTLWVLVPLLALAARGRKRAEG